MRNLAARTAQTPAEVLDIGADVAKDEIVVLAPGYWLADPTVHPLKRLRKGVRLKPLG